MLTNLRLADLRLRTVKQRTTGQDLPSGLYIAEVTVRNSHGNGNYNYHTNIT
jgi:hypothetical protein